MAFPHDPQFKNSELIFHSSQSQTSIYTGYSVEFSRPVVYKVLKMTPENTHLRPYVLTEVNAACKHKSPFICETLSYKELPSLSGDTFVCVVMERLERDWEREMTEKRLRMEYYAEGTLWRYLAELVGTLAALQKDKLAHRDIKPANIFVKGDILKIGDFGSSREKIDHFDNLTILGTEDYLSPLLAEAHANGMTVTDHNVYKSDVFSLGMSFVHAMFLELKGEKFARVKFRGNKRKVLSERPYSSNWINIMLTMLEEDESSRPDFLSLSKWMGIVPNLTQIQYSDTPFCVVCREEAVTAVDCRLPCGHYFALCSRVCIDEFQANTAGQPAFSCCFCRAAYERSPAFSAILLEMRQTAPFVCLLCKQTAHLWTVCCTTVCEGCLRARVQDCCSGCGQAYNPDIVQGLRTRLSLNLA